MFIDIRHSKPAQNELHTGSHEGLNGYRSKNKSLDVLPLEEPSIQSATKKVHHHSKLKRSSVLLDNTLVREYNLAISHFEKLDSRPTTPIQSSRSNKSISSTGSRVSSLFSSRSTLSIHDLLYDGLDKDCEDDCEILDQMQTKNSCRLRIDDLSNGSSVTYERTNLEFE